MVTHKSKSNSNNEGIKVEVAYANEQGQKCIQLFLPMGSSVKEAILASKLWIFFPEFNDCSIGNLEDIKDRVGIFSEKVSLETLLNEGDRVEIYRPLKMNPKESRWLRVKKERRQTTLALQRKNIEKKLKRKANHK